MKTKTLLISVILAIFALNINAQECLTGGCSLTVSTTPPIHQYPTGTFSTTSSSWTTVNSAMNGGNWTLFSVTNGYTYEWTNCEDYGGISTGWDSQLTLYNYSTGNKLCYSDDYCGANGNAPYISWTATFTGTVQLLTSVYNCNSNGPSGPYNKLVWRRVSSSPGCTNWSVSPSSQNVPASGGSYSATVSASGSCTYSLTFSDSWVVFDSYGSGGVFNYHVTSNTGSARTSPIYVNDVTGGISNITMLTVSQSAAVQTGSVTVTILPSAAVSAGATWKLDGAGNYPSGYVYQNVSTGSHTISFNSISGWATPSSQTLTVTSGNTASATGTYVQNPTYGSISVTITPGGAISSGAMWNIDGGTWQTSGTTLNNITTGNHTVYFNSITGWSSPGSQSVSITAGNTTTATGVYTQIQTHGSLCVNVYPAAASNAGAKWNLDGTGSWYSSGYTLNNVSAGNHFVAFNTISGWTSPVNQNVTIYQNQTSNISGTYVAINNTSITLSTPNGGENFIVGETRPIMGNVSLDITNIQLEYTTDNGLTFFPISSVAPNSGSFIFYWNVPATPASNCKIRSTGTYPGGSITDLSDAVFTISLSCFPYDPDCDYCYSTYPYQDAPSSPCVLNNNNGCLADSWGFCQYNCTSWTAWCINKALGYTSLSGYHPFTNNLVFNQSTHLGDAADWESALTALGYVSDNTPATGAIAWYAAGTPGTSNGHVAFTNCVNGSIVTLTEFNYQPHCYYNVRVVDVSQPSAPGNRTPTKFIHLEVGGLGSGPSSIADINKLDNDVVIYPNPANDVINIEFVRLSNFENVNFSVFNIQGQLVIEGMLQQQITEVNINEIPAGVYILMVRNELGVTVKKFVKQ